MEYLFSYGTLQLLQVQLDTFGRPLQGQADSLSGFVLTQLLITDPAVLKSSGCQHHPMLHYTACSTDIIKGTVFMLTVAELLAADSYEVDAYQRVMVKMASGLSCWVYAAASEAAMIAQAFAKPLAAKPAAAT